MTYAELKARLREEAFPEGLAPELSKAVYSMLRTAIIDLQRRCPKCLAINHTDIRPFASTYWQCGTSVVCSPAGTPRRVYTVSEEFCQPVDYVHHDYQRVRDWSRGFARRSGTPDNAGLPTLQLGLKYPKDSTDWRFGRAGYGVWTVERDKLIVAPWIQSNESIVVEWDGFKSEWNDADLVGSGKLNEDTWFNAIVAYVLAEKAKRFDADYGRHDSLIATYDSLVSTLMCDCQDQTENINWTERVLGDAPAIARENWVAAQTAAQSGGTITPSGQTVETPSIYSLIGDYGLAGADELAVSTLVKSWDPLAVFTSGDNNYEDGAENTIDQNVGQFWARFISPYKGTYPLLDGEVAVTSNAFWPSIGNHDLDSGSPPVPYLNYFTLPGNGRFYSVVSGICEFFIVNSGLNTAGTLVEPAGNTKIDFQAAWLRAALAASTAKFRIVIEHHPPFTSDELYYPGIAAMRWPFKDWGADVVFSGHAHSYEHIIVDGLDYIVCGASGAELRCFAPTPVSGSQKRYCAEHGAIRMSVVCAALTIEFINVSGEVIDTVVISNDNPAMNSVSQPCQCVSSVIYQDVGNLSAPTVAAARLLPNLPTNRTLAVFGQDAPNDGGAKFLNWDQTSLEPDDDGHLAIKPSDTISSLPGRWLIMFGG